MDLKDTIIPYNKYTGEGNGFSFRNYNANELLTIIEQAINTFYDKNAWNSLVRNALSSDNSWEKSAQDYKNL